MISVVIPLYNKADTILKAVESVRAQTDADWELIVVDDGSRDDGAARVEALAHAQGDARIRVLRQANGGVAVARNTGLRAARHEWVALLDADDYWDAAHLARLRRLQAMYPQAVLCGAAFSYVGPTGLVRPAPLSPEVEGAPDGMSLLGDYFLEIHRYQIPFNSSSVMLRKEVALRWGGFEQGVVAGEDLLMWARMACAGAVAMSAQRTAYYVEPPIAHDARVAVIRRPQKPDVVGRRLAELCAQHPANQGLRLYLADWLRMRGVLFMELNERLACARELAQAIKVDTFTRKDMVCLGALMLPAGMRSKLLARYRAAK